MSALTPHVQQPVRAWRVLIADDTASCRELLRFILEGSGYEVAEAVDGVQVLALARDFHPDVVILDLQMPELDGYAAATSLRGMAEFTGTPIVALTATVGLVASEKIAEAGFTAHLVKPIGPAKLRQCVAALLAAALLAAG